MLALLAASLVAACGGGSSGGSAPTSNAPPASTGCSLTERKNWAVRTLREWYLYPDTLPATIDVNAFPTVDAVIDEMTKTARASGRDRFWTYLASITEENAFFSSGSSAGFGIRLVYDSANRRVFISEAFEETPALRAGLDRRDEILGIGNTASTIRNVSDIFAVEGATGVSNALGPSTAGTTRVLRVTGPSGTRDVTVTKADYSLAPVSDRYGALVLQQGSKQVGYLNLRTFIQSANSRMIEEFDKFRAAGIREFVIDLRYNGGGLVSVAGVMGDLLGGNRTTNEIFYQLTFRESKSIENEIRRFGVRSQATSPVKMAFITSGASASASELVVNGFVPYLNDQLAMIGSNTFGKPVGQVGIDNPAGCDDRLRVVAFTTRNAANSDNYFGGLVDAVRVSCSATDDLTQALGNPNEASIRQALGFLRGESCTAISRTATGVERAAAARGEFRGGLAELEPLEAERPTIAQRNVPGLF